MNVFGGFIGSRIARELVVCTLFDFVLVLPKVL